MYDDSEGYDDMGRKNVSREVVEEDFESKYMNKMKNQDSLKSSIVVLKHELCMTLRLLFPM